MVPAAFAARFRDASTRLVSVKPTFLKTDNSGINKSYDIQIKKKSRWQIYTVFGDYPTIHILEAQSPPLPFLLYQNKTTFIQPFFQAENSPLIKTNTAKLKYQDL